MRLSLDRVAHPFVVLAERFYPDPFVFAIVLTGMIFSLTLFATETTPVDALMIWGEGLTGLLAFTSQICVTLIGGHALAHTDVTRRGIDQVAGWPQGPRTAYALVAGIAGLASLIAGALGLVVGGLLAVSVARRGKARGLRLHYPLLVASAYSGFLIWHMGYSGTAPLAVATPGHALEATLGVVPITTTTFSAWNVALAFVTLAVVAGLCSVLGPRDDALVEIPEEQAAEASLASAASAAAGKRTAKAGDALSEGDPTEGRTPGARLDAARPLSAGLGGLLLIYLLSWFVTRGFALTLDVVNWTFVGLGLVLARSPRHYVDLVLDGSRIVGPVLLQYPFYAGVVALMMETDLVRLFSEGFVAIATPATLGFWAFISGGLLNFFVPSGGGQWAIQGPIFAEAAAQLGVAAPPIVMGVAYGDQWTNLIQPFWTLPLLAIAGLDARSIMGYCFVVFMAGFFVLGGGLLLLGAG
ncbi:MAG: short-chain fatty acid transporter [Myxococcota bacterium]